MIKCFCGFEWTDEKILKGFEKDEGGTFFYCIIDPNDYDGWDSCMGYVSNLFGNGTLNDIYPSLEKRYLELKEAQRIKEIRSKHKYTLEGF